MSNDGPDSPVTALDAEAIRLHELYSSYLAAGFPEPRAFSLTCIVLHHYLEDN